jgi:5-methylcytosine-specific restriction endonuclease McrA
LEIILLKKEQLTYEPYEVQSRAALLALRKQYLDDPAVDSREPYRIWLSFRMKLLTKWEQERGMLSCAYCGQPDLAKMTDGVEDRYQATLDHVKPRAAGGAEFDENNLVVACRPCNEKKADTYEETV